MSWDGAAPATWDRHLATLGSFTTYTVRRRWREVDPAIGLQRRKETVELQAKSRHTSLRTLGRYVNPGPELAARVTAETDPAARRRS